MVCLLLKKYFYSNWVRSSFGSVPICGVLCGKRLVVDTDVECLQETGSAAFSIKGEHSAHLHSLSSHCAIWKPNNFLLWRWMHTLVVLSCLNKQQCCFLAGEDSLNIKYDLFPIKHQAQTKCF